MTRRFVIALLPCVLGACSLLVNTDGLSGSRLEGADAAPHDDASSDLDATMAPEASTASPSDASPSDASPDDAGPNDAGPNDAGPGDAGPDDAGPSDAGPDASASPCAVTHLFCDDFDTGVLTNRWDSMGQTAGPLAFDSTLFVSPSRSLLATVTSAAGIRNTFLRKAVAVPANKVRVELDFRTDGPSGGSYEFVEFVNVVLHPAPSGYSAQELNLNDESGTSRFERWAQPTAGSAVGIDTPVLLPRGRWVHVVLEADFTSSPAKGKLSIDGISSAPLDLIGSSLTSVEVAIGPDYVNNAKVTWPLSYDNVIVDP